MQIKNLIGLACGLAVLTPATSFAAEATITGPDVVERGDSGQHWTADCTGCGGSTLSFEWDRENDGVVAPIDNGLFRPSIWNMYSQLGPVTMKVKVRGYNYSGGSEGTAEAIATKTITVVNGAPSADFTCDPARVETGEAVTCEVGGIGDDSGEVPATAWDVDGDGFDDGTADEVMTSFSSAGTNTVRLRVTDGDGASSVSAQDVEVWAPPAGPAFSLSATEIVEGGEVTFTATLGAGEEDDTVYVRSWDLDGDGDWDESGLGKRTVSASFGDPGTYAVRLRVRADGDPESTTITTQQLVVTARPVVVDKPAGDRDPAGGGQQQTAPLTPAPAVQPAPAVLAPPAGAALIRVARPAAKKPAAKKAKTCKAAKRKKGRRSRSCAATKRKKASRAKSRKRR